jgi:hypothetical protein
MMNRAFVVKLVLFFILGLSATAWAAEDNPKSEALYRLKAAHLGILLNDNGKDITRVYGVNFSSGTTPENSADQFQQDYAPVFGVDSDDLRPVSLLEDGLHSRPLMYDRQAGEYKFTLVYYSQFEGDIPVYMADLRLLVRNEPGYPLVLAASALRDLGDFSVPGGATVNRGLAESAARAFDPELVNISEPRLVIWAGMDDMEVEPALAMEIVADNGKRATLDYRKWKLLVDAQSGEVLYSENMIVEVDVTGNVSGMATQGHGADICGPEELTPMPYARVYISGGNTAYADASGDFVIPNGGSSQVTVISNIRGQWFRVFNQAGSDAQLSQTVTPPGPAYFIHNQSNSSEYNRAEVNGYVQANVVRDYALTYYPDYPTIWNQTEFPVNVNIADNCNAYYDYSSINFFTSGGGCANTAFSTVIHHEYGHHLVQVAGSGQGEYGEGMADVMGVLIFDEPGLAYGFYGDCDEAMRSADNDLQYPCSGEIHYCGQLLSGCVWETRNALAISYPDTYRDIISSLTIHSIEMHQGTSITPEITIDFLTLDDDDGNIYNGTPHYNEICSGFGAHNMDCPELQLIGFDYPNGLPEFFDPAGGTTIRVEVYGINGVPQPGTGMMYYNGGSGWISQAMEVVSPNVYDAVFPGFPCGNEVLYYFSAETDEGFLVTDPQGAPGTTYSAISAVGLLTVYEDDFSSDLGWTMDALWDIGQPLGGGGEYGQPDPSDDHSPDGPNSVLGYNLSGDYENYLPERYATSPTIDCSNFTGVTLTFYRWLGVEQPIYDHAYIRVSNDGSNWVTIFENTAEITDNSWVEQTFNVSQWADGEANFQVRFVMGPTDSGWRFCGWNVDDLVVRAAECVPLPSGTLEGTVTDSEGPPVEGVTVFADDSFGHTGSDVTASDGTYSITLPEGTYTVSYTHLLYDDVEIPDIVIVEDQTTVQDVVMERTPVSDIDVTPTEIFGQADPDGIDTEILTVANLGDGPLTFTASVTMSQPIPPPWLLSDDLGHGGASGFNTEPDPDKPPYSGPANTPDPSVILQGGDTFQDATVINSIPYSNVGTTAGYTNNYDEICPYDGSTAPDVVYAYTPPANATISISLCEGSDYDTKLYVYENDESTVVGCNDDACTSPNFPYDWISELTGLNLTAGNTYYIVVDGYGGSYGNYTIDIEGILDYSWLSIDVEEGSIDPGNPPIPITVTMDAAGLQEGTYEGHIHVSSNDPLEPDIDVPVSFEVGGAGSGTVYGTVTDLDSGDPISGVQVNADDGGGNTGSDVTGGDGTYSIVLPPSTYTVSFTHDNYYDATETDVVVTEGGSTLLDVQMEHLPTQDVPTLSEWGMMILALLLIASGTAAIIRRRKTLSEGAGK